MRIHTHLHIHISLLTQGHIANGSVQTASESVQIANESVQIVRWSAETANGSVHIANESLRTTPLGYINFMRSYGEAVCNYTGTCTRMFYFSIYLSFEVWGVCKRQKLISMWYWTCGRTNSPTTATKCVWYSCICFLPLSIFTYQWLYRQGQLKLDRRLTGGEATQVGA
jgi:hypothetical protein